MLSLCLFVRKRTNNHYRKRKSHLKNRKKWGFYWVKGAIICGLHDFERNTEKRHFSQRAEKHESTHFFCRKTLWRVVFFEKNYVSDNFDFYRNGLCAVFWYFCSFRSLVLFVGRNDGFDARNNDNFFKILWSNLINFDKKTKHIRFSSWVREKRSQ